MAGNDMVIASLVSILVESCYLVIFRFILSNQKRNHINIYVWDIMLPNGYKRFVLEAGYALAEDDEEMFIKHLHEDILVESILFENCIRRVDENYPKIHLKRYADWRQTL